MTSYLVDEALPRDLAAALRNAGISATDAREVGLRSRPDDEILAFACSKRAAVLTADVEFGNPLRFPPENHFGVVLARFPPEVTVATMVQGIVEGIQSLNDEDLTGSVVVLDPGRVRIRRLRR